CSARRPRRSSTPAGCSPWRRSRWSQWPSSCSSATSATTGCGPPRRHEVRMQILRGHTQVVPVLAFSPDGSLLASAGSDATVGLWRFPAGQEEAVLEDGNYSAPCLAFSPEGRWLPLPPVEVGMAARVWDLAGGFRPLDLPLPGANPTVHQWPLALAFTPD